MDFLGTLIGGITGLLGLSQANEQADRQASLQDASLALQQRALDASIDANKPLLEALTAMLGLAHGYNPRAETEAAVQRASESTQHTLERALGNLNAKYRVGGGTPGLSSEFNVRAQGLTDRVTDPLREFVANQRVNEFSRKLAAFQAVNGGNPGNLASNFFQASQNSANLSQLFQPQYGSSIGLLGNALQQLFNNPGSQATGGMRQAVQNMAQSPWRLGDDSYLRFGNGYLGGRGLGG